MKSADGMTAQQSGPSIEHRVRRHREFWERTNESPLVGYFPGDYFISRRFGAAKPLLDAPGQVCPKDFDPRAYLADYDRMYERSLHSGGDLIYTPEPFTGLPWMEAMIGLPVFSTESSFAAGHSEQRLPLRVSGSEWMGLYERFCEAIASHGSGRYALGQPILRGPCDLLGTMLGQEQFIYSLMDDPEAMIEDLNAAADMIMDVIRRTKEISGAFFGGTCLGFYHLWCPGDGAWFQDDLTALLSPGIYEAVVRPSHAKLSKMARYTMAHLHLASVHIIDYLLEMPDLSAIQINMDVAGPGVTDMLPVVERVLKTKNAVLVGAFSKEDIMTFERSLNPEGLYIVAY